MTKKIVIDYSEYQNIQKEINSLKEELYKEKEKNKAVKSLRVVKTVINKTVHEVKLLRNSESFLDVWKKIYAGISSFGVGNNKVDVESLAKMFFTTEIREEPIVEEISFHNVEDVKREYFRHITEDFDQYKEKLKKEHESEVKYLRNKIDIDIIELKLRAKEIENLREEKEKIKRELVYFKEKFLSFRPNVIKMFKIARKINFWNKKEKLKELRDIVVQS